MKKRIRNLKSHLKAKQDIILDIYEDNGGNYGPIAMGHSEEEMRTLELFIKNSPKFKKDTLIEIVGIKELVWNGIQLLLTGEKIYGGVYTQEKLKRYFKKPLKSLNHTRGTIEDILTMQYCLAFHSDYEDSCRTKDNDSKYSILVDEIRLDEVPNTYVRYPVHEEIYNKVKKEIMEDTPKVIISNLWRNTAANEFAFFQDIQNNI